MEIQQKWKVCAQWKQGQVTWEEYRNAAYEYGDKICADKTQVELKLQLRETVKRVLKNINGNRQCKNRSLLQDEDGHITNRDSDTANAYAFFASSTQRMHQGDLSALNWRTKNGGPRFGQLQE